MKKPTYCACVMLAVAIIGGCRREEPVVDVAPLPPPVAWQDRVNTKGQHYPIPKLWLSTPEAVVAHDLQLPDVVPKPVPFNFSTLEERADKKLTKLEDAIKYFRHLCDSEAGEWIVQPVEKVEGIYFARPRSGPSDEILGEVYGLEAPWIERHFQLIGETLERQAGLFVAPPAFSYLYVEEPKRPVSWQEDVKEKYIRLFGRTASVIHNPKYGVIPGAQRFLSVVEETPNRMVGIDEPTAKYAITWRGIIRPRDREFGIAGGEMIAYERISKKVLGIQRSFSITTAGIRGYGGDNWLVAATCPNMRDEIGFRTLSEFSVRVFKTIEPSVTGRK